MVFVSLSCTSSSNFLSGVDCVGTVSASLVAYAAIQALQPDLIINAGTAGGFKVLPTFLLFFYKKSSAPFSLFSLI